MSKFKSILYLIIGLLGMYLFLDHMLGFTPHDYFYINNPNIEKYIGTNVVSMFADLSFFTYHTLIFFSVWMIMLGISMLFNLKKINKFLRKDSIVTFIFLNYIVTTLLYTIFELTSGNPTFGLYANTYKAIYNLVTNLIVHYGYFIIATIMFIVIKPSSNTPKEKYFKTLLPVVIYLSLYYVTVKITGMYCYKIIWYPYPIFDVVAFSKMFGINTNSYFLMTMLLIIALIIIFIAYIITFILLMKFKQTKTNEVAQNALH